MAMTQYTKAIRELKEAFELFIELLHNAMIEEINNTYNVHIGVIYFVLSMTLILITLVAGAR